MQDNTIKTEESNANIIHSYSCPFDNTTLINVGILAEFEDTKDNYCCTKCNRIWVDCNQEEWWTRKRRVKILKEPKKGDNINDIIKVL